VRYKIEQDNEAYGALIVACLSVANNITKWA